VQTKSQALSERIAAIEELNKQSRQQIHEANTQESEQQHEMRMAQQEYLRQSMDAASQQQQQPEAQEAPPA
jgi:hypothetical protein